jgi:hypothetical protein
LYDVRFPLVGDDRIEHLLDGGQVPKIGSMGTTVGITHRTMQIALIGDLDDREAGVLHVVGHSPQS